jgi:hypothetical protein
MSAAPSKGNLRRFFTKTEPETPEDDSLVVIKTREV